MTRVVSLWLFFRVFGIDMAGIKGGLLLIVGGIPGCVISDRFVRKSSKSVLS